MKQRSEITNTSGEKRSQGRRQIKIESNEKERNKKLNRKPKGESIRGRDREIQRRGDRGLSVLLLSSPRKERRSFPMSYRNS